MKNFIKNRLNKLLTERIGPEISSEIGGKADVEFAKILKTKPYFDLLMAVREDWGKESDLYHLLMPLFLDDVFNIKKFIAILKDYDVYEQYKHYLNLNEEMIDGQNMNQGTQTVCNTMSVATYKEGLKLIIDAIGHPSENPKMWKRIERPLHNWQKEDVSIGQEIKSGGMSGDSMADESNTWWAAIQSTICEQGPAFQ